MQPNPHLFPTARTNLLERRLARWSALAALAAFAHASATMYKLINTQSKVFLFCLARLSTWVKSASNFSAQVNGWLTHRSDHNILSYM